MAQSATDKSVSETRSTVKTYKNGSDDAGYARDIGPEKFHENIYHDSVISSLKSISLAPQPSVSVYKSENDEKKSERIRDLHALKRKTCVRRSGNDIAQPIRIRYRQTDHASSADKREISHASLGKLVARLTDFRYPQNSKFRDAFLVTFPCFCTTYEFIKKLTKRYVAVTNITKDINVMLNNLGQAVMKNSHGQIVSNPVFSPETQKFVAVLMSLLSYYINQSGFIQMDTVHDTRALTKLIFFLKRIQAESNDAQVQRQSEDLTKVLTRLHRRTSHPTIKISRHLEQADTATSCIQKSQIPDTKSHLIAKIPKVSRSNSLTERSHRQTLSDMGRHITIRRATDHCVSINELNPTQASERRKLIRSSNMTYELPPLSGISAADFARQITLIEAEQYFASVCARELINKAWTRHDKYTAAPNVMALIELFDATAEWVSSEILHPQLNTTDRAKLIVFFIDVADHCYRLQNYNTLFEIVTGLSAPCIRDLKSTWSHVAMDTYEKHQILGRVCSSEDNYTFYRRELARVEGPRLPCCFILVKDLFTYETALPSMEDGLIHWQKFYKIYETIHEMMHRHEYSKMKSKGSHSSDFKIVSSNERIQNIIRHRLERIRKESSVLYRLARDANAQECILFVNTLSEAGFL